MNAGFLGLGSMGLPMARNLARAGHDLLVWNRTASRAAEVGQGAVPAPSPFDAASRDVVITMVADDRALEDVTLKHERGILQSLPAGAIHVSMSTISIDLARTLSDAHAARGQLFVSAPVFGRPAAAEAGKLWIVAAGAPEAIERCRPLFDAMGQETAVVGPDAPAANVVKLAGNFMIASMVETLGEAFALVRRGGIDPAAFLAIANGALFKSPIYENYGGIIARGAFEPPGFRLRLGLKDVRLVLGAADAANVPMPVAGVIRDHLLEAMAWGMAELDFAALARVVAENAGLD